MIFCVLSGRRQWPFISRTPLPHAGVRGAERVDGGGWAGHRRWVASETGKGWRGGGSENVGVGQAEGGGGTEPK